MSDQRNNVDQRLRQLVENIERLEEEKKEISQQITDVYREGKALGFNTKIMRKIVSLRKMDEGERMEMDDLIDTYKEALGMP